MKDNKAESISMQDYNITDFGATGNDVKKDTNALQQAIDKCSTNGGGTVLIPSGKFIVGSFDLKSHVNLHLSDNAILLASPNQNDYRKRLSFPAQTTHFFFNFDNFLIYASDAENISITGRGVIDGNGRAFFLHESRTPNGRKNVNGWRPGNMVMLVNCHDILIRDIILLDSPAYTVMPLGCERVVIDNLTIKNDRYGPNTDGIDVTCCRDVRISNCSIIAGDDCITCYSTPSWLKNAGPCENVTVTNCVLSTTCCGFRLGFAPTDLPIRNCVFSNIVMHNTTTGISMLAALDTYARLPCDPYAQHGQSIENISFSNIIMDTEEALYLWTDPAVSAPAGIRNVSLSNIIATGRYGSFIGGSPTVPVDGIRISNMKLTIDANKQIVDGFKREPGMPTPYDPPDPASAWGQLPGPHALYIRHAKNISLHDVEVIFRKSDQAWQSALRAVDVKRLNVNSMHVSGLPGEKKSPFHLQDTENANFYGCVADGKPVAT